jgi:hypothetical protein
VQKAASQKKLKQKKLKLREWQWRHMHEPLAWLVGRLNMSLRSHYNYYGVHRN